jgi:tetratricopeptide (TPR) repeat protein
LAGPEICLGLAFSPEGLRLAAAGRNRVMLWDTSTGEELLTLRGAPPRPTDNGFNPRVAFSPDGRRLVAINWDDSLSLWSADAADATPTARQQAAADRASIWHLSQARASLDAEQAFAADFHVRQLQDVELPTLLLRQRGDLHARRGRWPLAVRDYARVLAAGPSDDPHFWHQHALLYLKAENAAGFRKIAALMRERFGHNSDPDTGALLTRTCLLLPQQRGDGGFDLAWAEFEPKEAWRLYAAALAEYRAGQYEQAIRRCAEAQQANANWSPALTGLLQGLALQRLGRAADAHAWFTRAEASPPERVWWRRAEYEILRREVEAKK